MQEFTASGHTSGLQKTCLGVSQAARNRLGTAQGQPLIQRQGNSWPESHAHCVPRGCPSLPQHRQLDGCVSGVTWDEQNPWDSIRGPVIPTPACFSSGRGDRYPVFVRVPLFFLPFCPHYSLLSTQKLGEFQVRFQQANQKYFGGESNCVHILKM